MRWIAHAAAAAFLVAASAASHSAQIVVGQVGPLSGPEAAQGRGYATGMELQFNEVNRTGGINGHKFTLVRRDDGGRPEDTLEETRKLLAESKPQVLTGYFGTANVAEVLGAGLLEKEGIPMLGYRMSGIPPDVPLLFNARASMADEISKMVDHLATIGIVRLAVLHEGTPQGTAILRATEDIAKRVKAEVVAKASYPAGTTKVDPAVVELAKSRAQAVLILASGAATAAFIESYRQEGGRAQLIAHSGADIEQMSKRLGEEQLQGLIITQVTPSPYKVSARIAREFNDLVAKSPKLEVPPSYAMMEGYIVARVIVEMVRKAGAKTDRAALAAALENLGKVDVGGFLIEFGPGKRNGSRLVELSIVSGAGRIRQ